MEKRMLDFAGEEYRPYITYKFDYWRPLIKNCKKIQYKPNEYICYQYDTRENKLIVVESGIAKMTFSAADGKEHINFFGGRGYVFGFRALMSGSPYAGSLIAHSRCTVYKIPMEAVREKLLGDPEFMQIVFRGEYERGRAYSRKCEMLTLSSAKKKVICVILSLYNKIGYESAGKKCLSFNITHEQLSEIIYSDRVTVSRIISELKKSGYIEGGKSDIVINDYDKLYEMLSQN